MRVSPWMCVSTSVCVCVCTKSDTQEAHAQRICASVSGFRFAPLSPQRPLQSQEGDPGLVGSGWCRKASEGPGWRWPSRKPGTEPGGRWTEKRPPFSTSSWTCSFSGSGVRVPRFWSLGCLGTSFGSRLRWKQPWVQSDLRSQEA